MTGETVETFPSQYGSFVVKGAEKQEKELREGLFVLKVSDVKARLDIYSNDLVEKENLMMQKRIIQE